MNPEMRDWPVPLRINVVREALARELFEARQAVYGGNRQWDDLQPETKAACCDDAEAAIRAIRPTLTASQEAR